MEEVILAREEQRLTLRVWQLAKKLKKAFNANGHKCTQWGETLASVYWWREHDNLRGTTTMDVGLFMHAYISKPFAYHSL